LFIFKKSWVGNFHPSVRTFKTINYLNMSVPPEDKWLLLGLLNNTMLKLCII